MLKQLYHVPEHVEEILVVDLHKRAVHREVQNVLVLAAAHRVEDLVHCARNQTQELSLTGLGGGLSANGGVAGRSVHGIRLRKSPKSGE